MDGQEILSREIRQLKNERGDEVEIEVLRFENYYQVIATICDEYAPYRDYFAEATARSRMKALRRAVTELYYQAYDFPSMSYILYPRENSEE